MTGNGHVRSNTKSLTPPPTTSDASGAADATTAAQPLSTSERSNVDYFTPPGVCKRTGATEEELAVFMLKEKTDNGLDFSELNFPSTSSNENPEIFVDVAYQKQLNHVIIKVRNSNFGLKDLGFTFKKTIMRKVKELLETM